MATIWITGGKGFIGRHLARVSAGYGNRVFGIGHGAWQAGEAKLWGYAAWYAGEIEALELTQLAQDSGVPHIIFHLAGGSSVGASLLDPRDDFCRTVESTSRLLDWVRLYAPETLIVSASSAAVYGAGHSGPIAEDAPIEPYSPYGAHKAMMESLCCSYAKNFGLRVANVRLFSVYGAGLEKQLIWDLCSKLAASETCLALLGGTGRELRDWLYISDAVDLLWKLGSQVENNCTTVNGGTGIATSICEIADMVCAAWGNGAKVSFSGVTRAGDPPSLVADCAKIKLLGFNPRVMLGEGIQETVRWFKTRK